MPIKRQGCVAYDDPMHYRNGARYDCVGEVDVSWRKKIDWPAMEWTVPVGQNAEGGGYHVRTCVENAVKQMMGDANPFPDREWRQAMLLRIPPQTTLIIHNDANPLENPRHQTPIQPYERYHIPLYTNDKCRCYLHKIGTDPEEFDAYHCEVGKVFIMDPTILHYSENKGSTDRIHLCIDLKVITHG